MAQLSTGSTYLGVYHNRHTASASVASSSRTSFDVFQQPKREASSRNFARKEQAFARRNQHFSMANGVRRHGRPKAVAPYPMSYDPDSLNIDSIDHAALWQTRGGPSDFDFKEPPARSLDLGCGHASWILQTARVWKTTHFTGFDLVNIQPDLKDMPDIAARVTWVHGNFLTGPLPFQDGYFDHVYARGLEMAVPEDQWDFVISEIVRVLRPGGAVDVLVNDILFPYVPLSPEERAMLHKAPPTAHQPPPPILPEAAKPPPPPSILRGSTKSLSSRARKAIHHIIPEHDNDANHHQLEGDGTQTEPEDGFSMSKSGPPSGFASRPASSPQLSKSTSKTSMSSDPSRQPPPIAEEVPPVPSMPYIRPSLSIEEEKADPPRHVHEWLEDLFYAMFERRFINLTPTRILPNYLNIHLTGVTAGQHVKMPMIKPGTIYAALEDDAGDGSTAGSTTDEERAAPPPSKPEPTKQTPPRSRTSLDPHTSSNPASSSPSTPLLPSTPSSRLSLQTNGLPSASSNPPSASSSGISPNIVIDEIDSTMDVNDPRSPMQSTPAATFSSISAASSPPSSFSFSPKDAVQSRHHFIRPTTASTSPPPTFINLAKASLQTGQVTTMVFELQEHIAIGKAPAEGVLVESLADVAGRQRAVSSTSEISSGKSDSSTPKPEAPPKKRRRKPLKFVAASQALTMMLLRGYKVVRGCKEDMWEELLLQKGLRDASSQSSDYSTKQKITQLRAKFDHAFNHYLADMHDVAATSDGLVHALGMKRPARVKPTPAQEMDEQISREKRVEKTLSLIGWAYHPRRSVSLADGPRRPSASLEARHPVRPSPPDKENGKISEEEERPLFRSTRVFAGFKRTDK